MNSTVPPPRSKNDPLIGTLVNGKFRISALVASGGMGKIYRAEQVALNRTVALKVLHAQQAGTNADDPHFKKRFFREASILAKLQHPNIVTVFDYGAIEGTEDERYFMAMEFLSGETLARRINEKGALGAKDTIKIARQIARGLVEAHANGVIHRDLKPSNVMLVHGRDGEELAKIVDFGIVKIVGDESSEGEELTQEGSFIGSPKYMAPEQIQRGGKIDARTDVYSFGIILYQCLCGTVPFDGASSVQTLMAHLNQEPQPLRERAPSLGIPDWLEELVMACIAKEPEKRPQAMDSVARALAEAEAVFTSNRMLPLTGSGPHSPVSLLAAAGVQRSGSLPEIASSPSGRIARPSGITEQGTISSVRPGDGAETDKTRTSPGQKEGRSKAPIVLAAIGGAIAIAGLLFFALHRSPPPADAVAPPPPPAPVATAKRDFAMTIDSTPAGAEVREGDRVLGTTPLQLTIDNDGARLEPRRFVVSKDGFVPYSLVQGPSEDAVRVVASLVAAPAASASAPPAPAPVAHGPSRRAAPSPKPSAPPPASTGLDIRLTR